MSRFNVKLETKGFEKVNSNLDKFLAKLTSNVARAAKNSATKVRIYANSKYTPLDTGYMIDTSFDRSITVGNNPGGEIVYIAPYSGAVETNKYLAHGASYNIKYAREISMGIEHARKPSERYMFLAQAVLDKSVEVFNDFKQAAVNVTV